MDVITLAPPSPPATFALDSDAVVAQLRRRFSDPGYQPPTLPRVALRLHALTRQQDTHFKDLVRLLEQDPMLTGSVMRRAQSALYGSGQPVRSVHEAIVRLGVRTVGDIFCETALRMRVFRCSAYEQPMAELQEHSTAVAHFAQLVAQRTSICADHAFLYGLVHDVGSAAVMIALADGAPGSVVPYESVERAVVELHDELTGVLATSWGFPPDVVKVLSHHHESLVDGEPHPTVAVIAVAEQLAALHGFGIPELPCSDAGWAIKALRLPGLLALETEAEELAERLRSDVLAPH